MEFVPAKVRLLEGDNELLPVMGDIGELRFTVDFNWGYFQVEKSAWRAMASNGENRGVSPFSQRRAVIRNWAITLRKFKISKLKF